ncbi:protein CUSTOS isoform X1 [Myiozetetes cayanensis]|nr:protein CUSTOS isoform X1 [Myiozetetes cayanensis]XP_050174662.1 protein CUSTOS isoform X1 [Myiozetetes cayanensis]XP_050174663.1 protein CUSTOS isoform X1 [Myiozetetes cayanensis]XP_050174664.1 protein CUSTOS isoform X1 [Myiozetetes cayanensis]XP_050174666.1 protein CUSTOS isoform X1 [Myiozetetes cayanensis]XP_050174667.1 protein CUSTOS isoform X1 [Myiozetetes cayanensis]XP_050174668.1 protein CUSTOS isoform X1 [Myiozetetes cayanensis]XP_050174669.1 protein CUSTOS isoform X1 [Myiozetetes
MPRVCSMAAPRGGSGPGTGTGSSSDSDSDSDAEGGGEAAARFREAAWDCAAQAAVAAPRAEPRGGGFRKDRLQPKDQPSLRREVNGRQEGDNELHTTPEFRAHVARKLGAMLDSFITVFKDSSGPSQTSVPQSDSADDGFRLFSSSVPGDCGKPEPCPAARRRRPASSSDTDSDQEWERFQEAAVSAADILKQSGFPALSQDSSQDQSQGCVEHNQKKKKKKKKKKKIKGENNIQEKRMDPAECDQICKDLSRLVSANGQQERQNSNHGDNSVLPGAVRKKKKKKKLE